MTGCPQKMSDALSELQPTPSHRVMGKDTPAGGRFGGGTGPPLQAATCRGSVSVDHRSALGFRAHFFDTMQRCPYTISHTDLAPWDRIPE
jgi:hypothetical protein